MEEFYKKKIIRDFLTLFSESKWKNLCILCMEYGVLTLKQKYQVSSLSMEDIEEFVNDLIEEESKKNQKNLKKLRQGIISNTNFNYNNNNINSNSMANNTSTSFKPSSDWRKGEVKTIFDNEDTNKIFSNINAQEQNFNLNNNINNYHYRKNIENENIKINDNNNYIEPTTVSNEEPAFIKKGKDKLIDDILFPKQNKIVNYRKDNLFNNNLPKKQQLKQYKTSYNESYGNKKKNNINNYSNVNSKYKNYNDYNNTSFTEGISFNASKTLKRSSSFSNNTRFKSGLQKLKMTKPLNKMNNDDPMNNSFSIRANYSNKINNVPSKIKSQVDADKKIYGLLKNNKNQGNKYY